MPIDTSAVRPHALPAHSATSDAGTLYCAADQHHQRVPQIRILILILAMLTLAGCTDGATPTVAPNVTAQQQASAAASMGLTFPPETRFLLYHRASEDAGLPGPDDAVHLKVELPASAMANFLAQAPLSPAKWTSSHPLITNMPKWPQWQPSKIQKFRFAQFQMPKGQWMNVLIDDDKADLKVVYLVWFET
jgi:hypothetical protein